MIRKINTILEDKTIIDRYRFSSSDFTRNRKLNFKNLILFMLHMSLGSLQKELDKFFKELYDNIFEVQVVSKAAFVLQRKKLKPSIFKELLQITNKQFYSKCNYKKWRSHRVVAIDGTKINIPFTKDNCNVFKSIKSKEDSKAYISVTGSICYDTLNNIIIDSEIGDVYTSEKELFLSHCKYLKKGDILLADRGYPSYDIFNILLENNVHFCIRIKEGHCKSVKEFIESGKKEDIIDFFPSKASSGKYQNPIKLRVLKNYHKDGTYSILCTSLCSKSYTYNDLINLYRLRWPIEEEFKTLKCRFQIENYSGKSALSVIQEFYLKCFMSTFCRVICSALHREIEEYNHGKKYNYKINFNQAIGKIKSCFLLFFKNKKIAEYLNILQDMIKKNRTIIRMNRSNKRVTPSKRYIYFICYKINY